MFVINPYLPLKPEKQEKPFLEKFSFVGRDTKAFVFMTPTLFNGANKYYEEYQNHIFSYAGKNTIGDLRIHTNESFPSLYLKGKTNGRDNRISTKCRWYMNRLVDDITLKKIRIISNIGSASYMSGDVSITFRFLNGEKTVAQKQFSTRSSFDISLDGDFAFSKEKPVFMEIWYEYNHSDTRGENDLINNYFPYMENLRIELYP